MREDEQNFNYDVENASSNNQVCGSVCIYTYIYVYILINIRIYTKTHTLGSIVRAESTCGPFPTVKCVAVYVYTYICIYIYMHMYIYTKHIPWSIFRAESACGPFQTGAGGCACGPRRPCCTFRGATWTFAARFRWR